MAKQQRTGKTVKRIGAGFYIALTICILAVGGMAVSTFTATIDVQEEATPFTTGASLTTTSAAPVVVSPETTVPTAAPTTEAVTTVASRALAVWPLGNTVATPYSETPLYSETMEDYRPHCAIDLKGDEGDTVVTLAEGSITGYEEDALWGGSLTVSHGDGVVSVYRGVSATVQEGNAVAAGDPIGVLVGVPCERASGMHLHLELYRDGKAVDPMALLQTAPSE